MKVYIVERHEPHEFGEVIEVLATKELAECAVEALLFIGNFYENELSICEYEVVGG